MACPPMNLLNDKYSYKIKLGKKEIYGIPGKILIKYWDVETPTLNL